jgi:F-box and leucine-rich repeat protein 1 (S-phase kinase-associated protein 2)
MTVISCEELSLLLSSCTHLKNLSVENCAVSDQVCRFIGVNSKLTVLNLALCEGLKAAGLLHILDGCTRLQSLNIAWTGLTAVCIHLLATRLPTGLTALNISGCRNTLTNSMLDMLAARCTLLHELDISDSGLLTGETIDSILTHLHRLQHLGLSRCYNIQPTSLLLLDRAPNLRALDMYGVLYEAPLQTLRANLTKIDINKSPFSTIARPTTGIRRTSVWGLRVRD